MPKNLEIYMSTEIKKIIIATGIFQPDIGGPATYSKTLAQTLSERGFNVTVLTYGKKNKTQDEKCGYRIIRVSRIWPKGIRHFIYFLKLYSVSKKANLIYTQNPVTLGVMSFFVSRLRKIKYAVKIVGDKAWETAQNKGKTILSVRDFQNDKKRGTIKLASKLQALTCKKADLVIVPSVFLSKIVSGWGADKEKIKVIYNGVDVEALDVKKEEARVKIGISGNIILSVGRLVPWKGFKMLIKIMPELLKFNPFLRLVIVGDGPEKENLNKIVNNLRLKNKVYLVGRKTKADTQEFLAASDVFVLNTFYEGFSHQLIEVMASGVPLITTSVCGNPEIVEQGENGFMVKFNDERNLVEAIKTIRQREDISNKFIENGLRTAERFTNEKMLSETLKEINLLI